MCELLALNANTPTDMGFSFRGLSRRGGASGEHADGWGLASFTPDSQGLTLLREEAPAAFSALADQLSDRSPKALVSIAHIRKATRGVVALENCHPFSRSWRGQTWVFAHNGDLSGDIPVVDRYRPFGSTDSETAFCWILEQLDQAGVDPHDPEALFAQLHRCAAELAERGTFNALISNGQWLFATATSRLHWLTRRAPFRSATLVDPPLQVDFSTLTTAKDVVTILSTEPLTTDEHWQPLQPGESLLFCAGELMQRNRHGVRPAPMAVVTPPSLADPSASSTGAVSLKEASRFWLRLGLVSFGGPAGQIALLHSELVDRRRWLSERRFLHALNYCMLLPGPEATQLATYLGWLMHGVPGGLIAGGLFLAPSVLVLTTLATGYGLWGQLPLLVSVFAVLKPAVLAIVLVAAWRVGQRALRTPLLIGIAAAAFLALAVLRLPYPLVVVGAALAGLVAGRWRPGLLLLATSRPQSASQTASQTATPTAINPTTTPTGTIPTGTTALVEQAPIHGDHTPTPEHCRFSRRRLALIGLVWGLAVLIPLALLSAAGGWNGTLALMARFFTRVALLSFGGAYAVLPYVAQGAVEQFGWLTASQMLDGLALGETTPGPLIMVVAFVGFMGGWNRGFGDRLGDGIGDGGGNWPLAVAATLVTVWFTFLPSFGFILAGAPLVEASRGDLRFGAPLTAITAAVVGVIASLAVFFAGPVLWPMGAFSPGAGVVVALGLLAQLQWRWSVLQVIGAAAAAGVGWAGLAAFVG